MKSSLRSSVPALVTLLFAGAASAGDIASFRSIGFSGDGKIFAYEEYGIQDGSGFPYSNIYAVDLTKDAYLPGTPFRVKLEQDGATVARARWQARNAADVLIDTHELANHPAEVIAFNPVTEVSGDPHKLRYRDHATVPPAGGVNTLVLEEIHQPADVRCHEQVEKVTSFRIRFTEREGKAVNEVVHEDQRLPASRACATGYRLGGVFSSGIWTENEAQVALIFVLTAGFEGSQDGRWIVVPLKVPN